MPVFNKEKYIRETIESVLNQTLNEFEFIIIDDGSTDNTEEVVQDLLKDTEAGNLKQNIVKKENGGLHTGYNKAIELAQTELMVCVDSDDYMPDQAVEKILNFWKENGSDQYAGIIGLDYDLNDYLIGDPLPNQKTINLIDLLVGKYPIVNGDRTNVIRTELYKAVAPMKSFEGEKNFNPHYMHLEISKKIMIFLLLNENTEICRLSARRDV